MRGKPAEPIHHSHRLLLGTTLALGLCLSQTASAEPPPWLDWSAPPECPTAGDIERRVAEWVGGPFPTETRIAVRTALGWNGERWEVAVEISFDGQSGKRRVAVRDCQEAADFVAVAVALAVDPSLGATIGPGGPPAGAGPEVATVEPNPDAPAEQAASGGDAPAQLSGRDPAGSEANVVRPKSASDESSPVRPHVSASAEGAVGALPEPSLGVGVALGGDIARLSFCLAARWFPPKGDTPEAAVAPIDFSLVGGRVALAYLFFGPEARVGPSLALDAGAIRAKQLRSENAEVVEPWVSMAAGAMGLVALTQYVSVFSEFELEVPLTRTSFVLSDQSVVHRVGVGARAALGLRISFLGQ